MFNKNIIFIVAFFLISSANILYPLNLQPLQNFPNITKWSWKNFIPLEQISLKIKMRLLNDNTHEEKIVKSYYYTEYNHQNASSSEKLKLYPYFVETILDTNSQDKESKTFQEKEINLQNFFNIFDSISTKLQDESPALFLEVKDIEKNIKNNDDEHIKQLSLLLIAERKKRIDH